MQVVKNIFISLFVLWFAIFMFMPKQELYYTLEKELLKQGVKINEKSIEEGLFSLTLSEVTLYAKGIQVATIEEVSFFSMLFYNSLSVNAVEVDDDFKSFVPQNIEKTIIVQQILAPTKAYITSMGSFGLAEGTVDLTAHKVRLDLIDAKDIKTIKSQLKKGDKGWYYETSF